MKGFFKGSTFGAQVLQFVFLLLFFLSLAGIFSSVFVLKENTSELSFLRTLICVQFFFLLFLFPLSLSFLWSEQPLSALGLTQKLNFEAFLFVFLFMLILGPFVNFLAELNSQIVLPDFLSSLELKFKIWEESAESKIKILLDVDSFWALLLNIGLLAVLPAFGEELFFRGTLQNLLQKRTNSHFAVWFTAFLFSCVHFQFYGFIPRFLLGAFLGYLFVWSGSLWLPIFAHFVNNTFSIVINFFSKKNNLIAELDDLGGEENYWVGCLSGLLVCCVLYFLKKQIQEAKKTD